MKRIPKSPEAPNIPWHAQPIDEVVQLLGAHVGTGLGSPDTAQT